MDDREREEEALAGLAIAEGAFRFISRRIPMSRQDCRRRPSWEAWASERRDKAVSRKPKCSRLTINSISSPFVARLSLVLSGLCWIH